MNLYILRKFIYGDDRDESGGEYQNVAACLASDRSHAIWQFRLMHFDVNESMYDVQEYKPFDNDGHMFILQSD